MEKDQSGPKYQWKNVYVGRSPYTNRPRFERRKVLVTDPNQPPEVPLDSSLLTEEELEKKMLEKVEKDFEKSGYPTKGSQPSSDFEPEE
jgi:hypothetical protein